jgi:glutathione S-transferase
MLRILGKASSINVRKVLWTCTELGLAYEHEETPDPAALLALNPNGLVPVIRDGERVLWESNSICRYLAAREGRHDLLPGEPWQRAQVERWIDWQATELNTAWRDAFMGLVRRDPRFADPARIAAGIAGWNRAMGLLEGQLAATGAHVAGPGFTLADVVLGLSVNRWLMTPMERPGYPAISAYVARLESRPGWRAYGANGIP